MDRAGFEPANGFPRFLTAQELPLSRGPLPTGKRVPTKPPIRLLVSPSRQRLSFLWIVDPALRSDELRQIT